MGQPLRAFISTEPVGAEAGTGDTLPVVVLSEQEFATCVRRALRDSTRPAALAANPSIQSRLVSDGRGNDAGAAARLQALLRKALNTLTASPRDEKSGRALHRTFFQPAATQEAAAERLDLPFSTYQYHLARGEDRVVEWLWRLELAGWR